jgi:hypoxanthine phosphoribosyltransferase
MRPTASRLKTGPLPVLIIDDICTTGATLTAILDAFCQAAPPEQLITFTLAKTGHDPALNDQFQFKNNQLEWRPGSGWVKLD